MVESQIAHLVAVVPPSDKGKILGQPEDLETANLVNIHNAAYYYMKSSTGRWKDYTLLKKKSDLGRPIIPISIGPHIFQEAICDFGASVNIMPKEVYEKIGTQICIYSLQISHSATLREFLKMLLYEWDNHTFP
jgi:hypothetical protein